ncbi:hypothetical protein GALL_489500 [mine drainage metagenome]|uniref:Uncharacterized protein n=1 Tax=mine drainage metagenome TaxID=410659 RepID=A0A1J5PE00_9ZZZZ
MCRDKQLLVRRLGNAVDELVHRSVAEVVFRFLQQQYIQAAVPTPLAECELGLDKALASLAFVLNRNVVFSDDEIGLQV